MARLCLLLLWLLIASAGPVVPVSAAVITFDDLPPTGLSRPVPDGYGQSGFDWVNFNYLDGIDTSLNPSGYEAGVVSPDHVAFNAFGTPAMIGSPGPFTFTGAYLTSAWNDGLSVRVQGFLSGTQIYDATVNPSATVSTFFTFNYVNIDQLIFSSFGGTHHSGYDGGSGDHFAMDNFTFTPVPEPSTGLLVIAGLLGLVGWRRSRH